jgi:hypothetical protein
MFAANLQPVRIRLTRDNVCAGDDAEAPHEQAFTLPFAGSWFEFVQRLTLRSKLPSISGGHATWVLHSRVPLAVTAQDWTEPKLIGAREPGPGALSIKDGELCFFWEYCVQRDPDAVFRLLSSAPAAGGAP